MEDDDVGCLELTEDEEPLNLAMSCTMTPALGTSVLSLGNAAPQPSKKFQEQQVPARQSFDQVLQPSQIINYTPRPQGGAGPSLGQRVPVSGSKRNAGLAFARDRSSPVGGPALPQKQAVAPPTSPKARKPPAASAAVLQYKQGASKARIPGPAGALLQAQRHGMQVLRLESISGTQPSGTPSVARQCNLMDPDFQSRPWRLGVASAGLQRFDEASATPQHTIESAFLSETACKVQQLLVVLATLKPSDSFGNAFATLKDPTGQIGAGIHKDVLSQHSDVGVGAAMILQSVTVLKVPPQSCYACITAENIVKVFPSDTTRELAAILQQAGPGTSAAVREEDGLNWQQGILRSPRLSQEMGGSEQTAGVSGQMAGVSAQVAPRSMRQQLPQSARRHREEATATEDAEIDIDLSAFSPTACDMHTIRSDRPYDAGIAGAERGSSDGLVGSLFDTLLSPKSQVPGSEEAQGGTRNSETVDVQDDLARTGLWSP